MNNTTKWIGVDIFAGVGGMSLGFEQAGIDIVLAVDHEKNNAEYYLKNFPNTRFLCSDITSLTAEHIKSIVGTNIHVLFGGPPCQGFSLIGKRRSDDPRNNLIFEFVRLVKDLRPHYFVLENVKGLMLGNANAILSDFVERMKEINYSVITPIDLLNACDFGVPQKRERVFILGYANGFPMPEYPKPTTAKGSRVVVWDAIGDLPDIEKFPELFENDVFQGELNSPSHYAAILRKEVADKDDLSIPRTQLLDGLSGCLRTSHLPRTIKRFNAVPPGGIEPISRFHRLQMDGLSPTLRAGTGKDKGSFMAARPIHPLQSRCITVREAARLHSFPDWFQFHPTKWHGFRQVGNSVPPLMARQVAKKIVEALESINPIDRD